MNDIYLLPAQRALIDKLNPAARSHYANTPPCQSGTRTEIFGEIDKWAQDQTTSETLLWLHGHAGMGKSSIASSLCRKYNGEGALGAHFFCKRDDPGLRSPENILNTIVHRLASQYETYGRAVANAIADNIELPESPLEQRYAHLIDRPLQELKSKRIAPAGVLLVVVDALDECEKGGGRRLLLTYLRKMSQIAPWLKVVVTSRPDHDIKKAFGTSDDATVSSHNLLTYDASHDILAFTRKRMTGIAEDKDQLAWSEETIQLLSERACGLFIWVETACKFIEEGFDMDACLKQILEGTQPTEGSEPLDVLYTTAIKLSMGNQGEDNMSKIKKSVSESSWRLQLARRCP